MSNQLSTIPIVRLVSGHTRWQHSCVYQEIGRAIVDPGDYEWASGYRWILIPKPGKPGYVRRHESFKRKVTAFYMHSEVWTRNNGPIPDGLTVDHKDLNTWDNRSSNLRLATTSQQGFNKGLPAHNTSGYKGVSFNTGMRKYKATIRCKPDRIHLGWFDTVEEAAAAYGAAALKLHGEFVCLKSDA